MTAAIMRTQILRLDRCDQRRPPAPIAFGRRVVVTTVDAFGDDILRRAHPEIEPARARLDRLFLDRAIWWTSYSGRFAKD